MEVPLPEYKGAWGMIMVGAFQRPSVLLTPDKEKLITVIFDFLIGQPNRSSFKIPDQEGERLEGSVSG